MLGIDLSYGFTVSMIIGGYVVLLNAIHRYNQSVLSPTPGDPLAHMMPRHLTSDRDFVASLVIYVVILELLFIAPSLAVFLFVTSGEGVAAGGRDSVDLAQYVDLPFNLDLPEHIITLSNFPIFFSLALVGAVPYIPFVNVAEERIRRFCHAIAYIPRGITAVMERIANAHFNVGTAFGGRLPHNALFETVKPTYFDARPHSVERRWARLVAILHVLSDDRPLPESAEAGAREFLETNKVELDRINAHYRSMRYRIRDYFAKKADLESKVEARYIDDDQIDPNLAADVQALLTRLEMFLACALRVRYGDTRRIVAALQEYGFEVDWEELPNPIARTLIVLAVALFVVGIGLGWLADTLAQWVVAAHASIELPAFLANLTATDRVVNLLNYTVGVVLATLAGSFMLGSTLTGISSGAIETAPILQRPIERYLAAGFVGGLIGALILFLIASTNPDDTLTFGEFLRAENSVPYLWWVVSLTTCATMLHIFAHGPGSQLKTCIGEGLLVGLVFGLVNAAVAFVFFNALPGWTTDIVVGAAIYYALFSWLTGTAVSILFLYVYKTYKRTSGQAVRVGRSAIGEAFPVR